MTDSKHTAEVQTRIQGRGVALVTDQGCSAAKAAKAVHSFDPYLACAIHLVDTRRRPIVQVKAFG